MVKSICRNTTCRKPTNGKCMNKRQREYRKNYEDYLKSDEWKAKRKHIAELRKYTCEVCGKVVLKGFHIHHKTYEHFKYELDSELMFLCEDCHTNIHIGIKAKKNNQKKPKQQRKTCANCFYSQRMVYKSKIKGNNKKVLWCNYKYAEAGNSICSHYKKGKMTVVKNAKPKKQKRKVKK